MHEWRPFEVFLEQHTPIINAGMLILNQPITKDNECKLIRLWRNSIVKFCVDGGANRLYEWRSVNKKLKTNNNNDLDEFVPDYICGDLDSVETHIIEYYKLKGTKIIRLNNQDLTDFTKTLKFAVNCVNNGETDADLIENNNNEKYSLTSNEIASLERLKIEHFYCFCEFSGRLDHGLSNLSTLYDECLNSIKTYLIGSESLTFLLKKGLNKIFVDNDLCRGKYCGLFPLGSPCQVTTTGLKWNLNKQTLKFGSFISSSNEYSDQLLVQNLDKKYVTIETDEPLLWTMSII